MVPNKHAKVLPRPPAKSEALTAAPEGWIEGALELLGWTMATTLWLTRTTVCLAVLVTLLAFGDSITITRVCTCVSVTWTRLAELLPCTVLEGVTVVVTTAGSELGICVTVLVDIAPPPPFALPLSDSLDVLEVWLALLDVLLDVVRVGVTTVVIVVV